MNLLYAKGKEVLHSLVPLVLVVVVLCFTIIEVETDIFVRFLVGSAMLLVGLTLFLWGVELSMNPIGIYMSNEVATSKTFFGVVVLSFLLGFLITVAEPDLLILGSQVEEASGSTLSSTFIVYMVSLGVGLLVALGIVRLLRDKPSLNIFLLITYLVILALAFLVSEEFLAISFDASGATTGALTTPFVLALTLGLSQAKGGKHAEENSFGLVGIMSAGPILAVMSISFITGQHHIHGEASAFVPSTGILAPILESIPATFVESLVALFPISLLFFLYNGFKFKLPRKEVMGIVKGLFLVLIGLVLFLDGVHAGFMDMGRELGMQIASMDTRLLIATGFVFGLIVVLMEPAVHVLGIQIEEVTAGYIPLSLIRLTLSLGAAIAISLSMVRITVPEVKLWYFLLPGFALALLLSFRCNPVFVGIAFDAGGVASGPMMATFILAFAQGAASVVPTADVLVDGFGVIAMVAMTPVFSIMLLGTIFRQKKAKHSTQEIPMVKMAAALEEKAVDHTCILVVVNRGFAAEVVDLARKHGAAGATILHGRGSAEESAARIPFINVELQPEREMVLLITAAGISSLIAEQLMLERQRIFEGFLLVYSTGGEAFIKTYPEG